MEIHDIISQILLVSKLNLTMIEQAAPEVNEKIQYAVELLSRAMKDLRYLSRRLDSDIIRQEGLYKAIGEYIGLLRKSVTKEIIFSAQGLPDHFEPGKRTYPFQDFTGSDQYYPQTCGSDQDHRRPEFFQ